jgi:hypothetical protein
MSGGNASFMDQGPASQLLTPMNFSPFPSQGYINTGLITERFADVSGNDPANYGASNDITKLHQHIKKKINDESKFLVKSMELLRSRPMLRVMLGGDGEQQTRFLAQLLKYEVDREWYLGQIKSAKEVLLRDIGPFGDFTTGETIGYRELGMAPNRTDFAGIAAQFATNSGHVWR